MTSGDRLSREALIEAAAKAKYVCECVEAGWQPEEPMEAWATVPAPVRRVYRRAVEAAVPPVLSLIADAIEAHAGELGTDAIRAGVSRWPTAEANGYSVAIGEVVDLVRSLIPAETEEA